MFRKIISGGQTGVDRGALDVALELGIPCGGWCPKDRLSEDGPIAAKYPLDETPDIDYAQRTEWNVRDADGTLVLTRGQPTGGTALTIELATHLDKPCLLIDVTDRPSPNTVWQWADAHDIRVVNVAGPRESNAPGIYAQAVAFLKQVLLRSTPEGRR